MEMDLGGGWGLKPNKYITSWIVSRVRIWAGGGNSLFSTVCICISRERSSYLLRGEDFDFAGGEINASDERRWAERWVI
jgi:hypothetical protein